jgi:hypothetical protein
MNLITFSTPPIMGLILLVPKYLQSITALLFARESYLYRVSASDLYRVSASDFRPQRLFLEFSEKTFPSYLSDGFTLNQEFIMFYPYTTKILWCNKGDILLAS